MPDEFVGFGFRIADVLFTVQHNLAGRSGIRVYGAGRKYVDVTLEAMARSDLLMDPTVDFAVMRLSPVQWSTLGVASAKPAKFRTHMYDALIKLPMVSVFGFDHNGTPARSTGKCEVNAFEVRHWSSTIAGHSGAPILLGNRVIGIHRRRSPADEEPNIGINIHHVFSILYGPISSQVEEPPKLVLNETWDFSNEREVDPYEADYPDSSGVTSYDGGEYKRRGDKSVQSYRVAATREEEDSYRKEEKTLLDDIAFHQGYGDQVAAEAAMKRLESFISKHSKRPTLNWADVEDERARKRRVFNDSGRLAVPTVPQPASVPERKEKSAEVVETKEAVVARPTVQEQVPIVGHRDVDSVRPVATQAMVLDSKHVPIETNAVLSPSQEKAEMRRKVLAETWLKYKQENQSHLN